MVYITSPQRAQWNSTASVVNVFSILLLRLWWIVSFVLSAYLCWVLINDAWTEWDQNPTIITFAEQSTPISTIPFPAITICPQIKTFDRRFSYDKILAIANLDHFKISKKM